ncbi:hypothetical protein H4S06_001335 [Coemansia sp. BCRC 34490]|nr:hypothetical protein H4S06_001335 [Coemansia sp. BCRC 34490]
MGEATKEHCAYCFDVLLAQLSKPSTASGAPRASFGNKSKEYPLFVTWQKRGPRTSGSSDDDDDGEERLRGCIGNFSPMRLDSGLREYALASALNDTRFRPVALSEVPLLSCAVSLLTDFEEAGDCMDWEVGVHGVWIEFCVPGRSGPRKRTATFLPEIAREQGWSKAETIAQLLRKGGYDGPIATSDGDEVRRSIRLTRYQSQKARLSYDEYAVLRKHSDSV